MSVSIGVLLLQLTGHRDLVTSIEMRSIPIGKESGILKEGEKDVEVSMGVTAAAAGTGTGTATDMIVSVSDDHTARVYYFTGNDLLT